MLSLGKDYEMIRITYSPQRGRMVASYFGEGGHCPWRASVPVGNAYNEENALRTLFKAYPDLLFTVVSEIKNDLGTFFIVEVEGRPNYLTE